MTCFTYNKLAKYSDQQYFRKIVFGLGMDLCIKISLIQLLLHPFVTDLKVSCLEVDLRAYER